MALDEALVRAYNDQINLEFVSSYAYLGMANWSEGQELGGFATWLRSQADEEYGHAMKFIRFVLDRDAEPTLHPIEPTPASYSSVVGVFEAALSHEQKVTAAINGLYQRADDTRDYASLPLLSWFIEEQVEEEATVRGILAELRRIGDDGAALNQLDREIATRRGADAT